jgi:hypothetical protein
MGTVISEHVATDVTPTTETRGSSDRSGPPPRPGRPIVCAEFPDGPSHRPVGVRRRFGLDCGSLRPLADDEHVLVHERRTERIERIERDRAPHRLNRGHRPASLSRALAARR